MLYEATYMRYLKQSNSWRQKEAWWLQGLWAEGNEELVFNGCRASVL